MIRCPPPSQQRRTSAASDVYKTPDPYGRAHALIGQAVILAERGTVSRALALHEESEQIYRRIGSPRGIERALANRAAILIERGDLAAAELLASVAPDLDVQTRRLILDEALGNPLALLELPRAFRLQGTDGREGALRRLPRTERLELHFSAQAGQLPKHTQAALLLVAVDKAPAV